MERVFLSTGHLPGVPQDLPRDVHPGGVHGVFKLHGVVHLVDQKPPLRLKEVHGHHPAPHGLRRPHGKPGDLLGEGAVLRLPAPGGVGDPVGASAVDGGDGPFPHHEDPDVPPGLLHVLLDVEELVLEPPQDLLVLQEGLRRGPVRDLGEEAAPAPDHGLQHHGVAEGLHEP
uniref:LysR transcriptional activator n=1 Tax=Thermus thermophilus TaxID=274 RepID=O50145_THETH|nr:LysR transcriptional activator [Thermus thermophilus HB27]